jgi:Uma2 family endonuclease
MDAREDLTRRGPWTAEEWLELNEASDGNRYELLDGSLLVSPPPSKIHQYVADELRGVLKAAAPEGFRVVSAAGAQVSSTTILIPDVLVMTATGFRAPDPTDAAEVRLAVEVVSPSSISKDRVLKPAKYATAGVPHYWRVELDGSSNIEAGDKPPVIFAHVLDGSAYRLVAKISAGTRAMLPGPFEVVLDPADLLDP